MLFVALTFTVVAQTSSPNNPVRKIQNLKQVPKVTTEFGLGIGARYNWLQTQPISSTFTPEISMPVSYGAALQFRLNIGRIVAFGLQPEISYARTSIKINDKVNNLSTKANSNIVQIPLLLSLRAAMFRFNAGPVFTLMDEATYQLASTNDESVQQMHLGRLYPTVTYAAGVSVKFAKIMTLDLRFADQFRGKLADKLDKRENQWIWTLDQNKQPKAQSFRTHCRSVQLRFGVVF